MSTLSSLIVEQAVLLTKESASTASFLKSAVQSFWFPTKVTPINTRTLKTICLDEVYNHSDPEDCWVVIYDRVYDITKFLSLHPGGDDVLLEHAGRDATFAYRSTGHSSAATDLLKQYEIGELPLHEQIYRSQGCKGRINITGELPE